MEEQTLRVQGQVKALSVFCVAAALHHFSDFPHTYPGDLKTINHQKKNQKNKKNQTQTQTTSRGHGAWSTLQEIGVRTAKTWVDILICFFIYSFIMLVSLFLWFKFEIIKDTKTKKKCGVFLKKSFHFSWKVCAEVMQQHGLLLCSELCSPLQTSLDTSLTGMVFSSCAGVAVGKQEECTPVLWGQGHALQCRQPSTDGNLPLSWTTTSIPCCKLRPASHEKCQSFSSCPSENFYFFPLKGNK